MVIRSGYLISIMSLAIGHSKCSIYKQMFHVTDGTVMAQ
jgi:hypothetical protein